MVSLQCNFEPRVGYWLDRDRFVTSVFFFFFFFFFFCFSCHTSILSSGIALYQSCASVFSCHPRFYFHAFLQFFTVPRFGHIPFHAHHSHGPIAWPVLLQELLFV